MRRRSGCALLLVSGLALLLLGTQVGWVAPERLRLRRADGSPAAGALVAVCYRGARFNFVHSVSYQRPGRVHRADSAGWVELPWRVYRKAPLDGYLVPWIDLLYDPPSHLACEVGARTVSVPGAYWVAAGGELVLADRSADPVAWERSLEQLASFVQYDLVQGALAGRSPWVAASPAEVRWLAAALHAEYQQLLARHGASRRQPPPADAFVASLPAAERAQIAARIAADLAREPLWSGHLQRRWPDQLAQLDRALARLP